MRRVRQSAQALGVALLVAAVAPSDAPAVALFESQGHEDARDVPASPLDVREVSLSQRELRMKLEIRTSRPWKVSSLGRGRALCVVVADPDHAARGSLCVDRGKRGPTLLYRAASGSASHINATVKRPDRRTLRASFAPRAVGLGVGPFTWSIESRWLGGRCAVACTDRAPDTGTYSGRVEVLGEPRCFAAAARDPLRSCNARRLERTVYPSIPRAYVWPNSPCAPEVGVEPGDAFDPCDFGVGRAQAKATFALIGDSHATHWRAALQVVAEAKRWRGVSLTRPGCPFSVQIPRSPALGPAACESQHAQTLAWLRAQPSIGTLFISDWAEPPGGPQGGIGGYGGGAASFGAMLDSLPATVRHVYVLRDIPRTTLAATDCVEARHRRHASLHIACGVARSVALTYDPGVAAARRRSPRVRILDLTRFFCGPERCYPVVGGAYVYKDESHMNGLFSTSLGPFVLRAMRRASSAAAASGSAHAARNCAPPAYPGSGYFTSLRVVGVGCAAGRRVTRAHYRCRVRHGTKGHCRAPGGGYRCTERRNSIPTEYESLVTCRHGSRRVVYSYQQNT